MKTLKLDITELEIDEQLKEISSRTHDRYFEYNETFKSSLILPPVAQYKTITFAEVSNPFALVVTSDKPINVKIAENEITDTKMVLLNTAFASLQVANTGIEEANITVYIWGKQ